MTLPLTGFQVKRLAAIVAAVALLFLPFEIMTTPMKLAVLCACAAVALIISQIAHLAPDARRIKAAVALLIVALILQLWINGTIRQYHTPQRSLHASTH